MAELRDAVSGLMGRAKDDLAELVTFKSVADPKQYPPEECQRAAQWVLPDRRPVDLELPKLHSISVESGPGSVSVAAFAYRRTGQAIVAAASTRH